MVRGRKHHREMRMVNAVETSVKTEAIFGDQYEITYRLEENQNQY